MIGLAQPRDAFAGAFLPVAGNGIACLIERAFGIVQRAAGAGRREKGGRTSGDGEGGRGGRER
jgi:hypothetical protein